MESPLPAGSIIPETPESDFNEEPAFLAWVPNWLHILTGVVVATILFSGISYYILLSPPDKFDAGGFVRIAKGTTIPDTAQYLYDRSFIRSRTVFKLLMRSPLASDKMVAGDYLFDKPISTITIVRRLTSGDFNLKPFKVTIPEGIPVKTIAAILAKNVTGFDSKVFYNLASTSEGYLFPDTYFISPLANEGEIVEMMRDNFFSNISSLRPTILLSARGEKQIMTMASIVELEASKSEDRKMIAGILWNRFDMGMRLQVDAVFPYILGKNTFQLTTKDLQVDSPYNTYRYKGLPPGPVSNPGLDAIKASLNPTPSKYIYYLSDKDGVMHYATTYEEHLKNKAKYLTR